MIFVVPNRANKTPERHVYSKGGVRVESGEMGDGNSLRQTKALDKGFRQSERRSGGTVGSGGERLLTSSPTSWIRRGVNLREDFHAYALTALGCGHSLLD